MDEKQIDAEFQNLNLVLRVLSSDNVRCRNEALATNDQFWRRAYVRSAISLIEGSIFVMRGQVLLRQKTSKPTLSESEMLIATEKATELKDTGQIKTRQSFQALKSMIRFTVNIYAKAFGLNCQIDFGSAAGWNALLSSIEIRNRLTHPKDGSSLNVSDDEMGTLDEAIKWFGLEVLAMMAGACRVAEREEFGDAFTVEPLDR